MHGSLLAVGASIVIQIGAASAGGTTTSACVKSECLYDIRIDVSLTNGAGRGIPSRPEGTISARLRATFLRVPFRELKLPGSKRYLLTVKRGLKAYDADTTAPGTLTVTVNATRPCRISRSYALPALVSAGGSVSTGGYFSVAFGPATAPTSSGCAGTAFGLQKIVVGDGSVQSGHVSSTFGLGEVVDSAPGRNDLGVLAGSYGVRFVRRPEAPVVLKLRAGRSFAVAHTFTQESEPGTPPETVVFRMTFTRVRSG